MNYEFYTRVFKETFSESYKKAQNDAKWKEIAEEVPNRFLIESTVSDIIYKTTFELTPDLMEENQYIKLLSKIREIATEAVRSCNQLAYLALPNGFSATCHDGNHFFSETHNLVGSKGYQSNFGNLWLSLDTLRDAEIAMRSFKDDNGNPLDIEPDTLVVGPAQSYLAFSLVNTYFQDRFKVVVSPYLIDYKFNEVNYKAKYNWFLLDTKRETKPIVIQNNKPITIESYPFGNLKIEVKGQFSQSYGPWQTAYGSRAIE